MSRFVLLDGIRGLAALFVFLRHTIPFWTFGFDRSFLAVDIFFLLSGFVIAQAYDDRLKTKALGVGEFMVIRLIRMYPMYALSLTLCLLSWLVQGQWNQVALAMAAAVFFLPLPVGKDTFLFTVNPPYWSLLFELAANFAYAVFCRWLTTPILVVVVTMAGLGIAAMAFLTGSIDYGWTWGPKSLVGGTFRAVFGVFMGLLIHRHRELLYGLLGRFVSPWLAFLLIGAALASPSAGPFDPAIDGILVCVVFPILILSASHYQGGRGHRLAAFLGAASYPLYVLHHQIGLLVLSGTGTLVLDWAPWSGFLLMLIVVPGCVLLERSLDLPIRQWLKRKLLPRRGL